MDSNDLTAMPNEPDDIKRDAMNAVIKLLQFLPRMSTAQADIIIKAMEAQSRYWFRMGDKHGMENPHPGESMGR